MSDSKKARNQTTRQGPSPEALAAFYRHRSEALRNSHTTSEDRAMNQDQKKKDSAAQTDMRSWYQRLFDALGGK